jgi:putative sigma-54 modulation protein
MKIIITGRHFDVTEDLSQYAEKKLTKLAKYFHKIIDINVIMYMEKHNHIVEAVINADSNRFYATEKAGDMYSSIDLLVKSMEKQAVKHKEKHSEHKVIPLSKTDILPESEPVLEQRLNIVFKHAENKPKDEIEAFLEMKLENKKFILFKKREKNLENNGFDNYAVIFKSGSEFKLVEIPRDMIENNNFDYEKLKEFNLLIHDDSLTSPDIKLAECDDKTIKCMELNDAINIIASLSEDFVPFFNNETNYLNIICKNGENLEVLTPPK